MRVCFRVYYMLMFIDRHWRAATPRLRATAIDPLIYDAPRHIFAACRSPSDIVYFSPPSADDITPCFTPMSFIQIDYYAIAADASRVATPLILPPRCLRAAIRHAFYVSAMPRVLRHERLYADIFSCRQRDRYTICQYQDIRACLR